MRGIYRMNNQDNEWQAFLETGKEVPKAIKPKEIVDFKKALKTKYTGTPMPNPDRIIRVVSAKQQRGIRIQQGAR